MIISVLICLVLIGYELDRYIRGLRARYILSSNELSYIPNLIISNFFIIHIFLFYTHISDMCLLI